MSLRILILRSEGCIIKNLKENDRPCYEEYVSLGSKKISSCVSEKHSYKHEVSFFERKLLFNFKNKTMLDMPNYLKRYYKKHCRNKPEYRKIKKLSATLDFGEVCKNFFYTIEEVEDRVFFIESTLGKKAKMSDLESKDPDLFRFFKKKRLSLRNWKKKLTELIDENDGVFKITKESIVEKSLSLARKKIAEDTRFSINQISKQNSFYYAKQIKKLTGHNRKNFEKMINKEIKREINREVNNIRIEEHLNLIKKIIHKNFNFCVKNPEWFNDALGAGSEALVNALSLYEPSMSSWSTYAWRWINAGITRHFENNDVNSLIKIPSHKHYDKSFNKKIYVTQSLDAKISKSDEDSASLVDMIPSKRLTESSLERNVHKDIIEKFGIDCFESFFNYYKNGKKFKSKKFSLEEVITYLKKRHF